MESPLINGSVGFVSNLRDGPRKSALDRILVEPIRWHVQIQGKVTKFFRTGVIVPPHENRKRKPIGPWSMQSRMRLLRLLNCVDNERIGNSLFITLTYPDHVLRADYKQRSVDRAVFWRYVEKFLGRKVCAYWRIEWEERKEGVYTGKLAPHFHLMAFGVRWLDMDNVRLWWRKALRSGEGPLCTEVKRIKGKDAVSKYVSKYVAKYRSLDISTYHNSGFEFGRHWGILRKELVPYCKIAVERELTAKEIDRVQRYAQSRWPWYDSDINGGYTLLGERWSVALTKMFGGS